MNEELPKQYDGDFFIGVTYVPIEDNYYARRLESNRVVLSYFEMYQILKHENIPAENLLLRVLYAYILVYLRNSKTIPVQRNGLSFTHDDTRGCLFDMNGNKSDVVFSLDKPIVCDECTTKIRNKKVAEKCISLIKKEIGRIRKKKYYKIAEFVKRKPIVSICISAVFGIAISLIANWIFDLLKNCN